MRKLLLFVSCLLLLDWAYGQNYPAPNSGLSGGIISGRVTDANGNKPVQYASIALYKTRDSSLVTGAISGMDGTFSMQNVPFGQYYIEISFVGFKKQRFDGIMLTPKQKAVSLGDLKIEEISENLKEVEVVGKQNFMEYKIDRKVIAVSQDIASAGGSAVDVLQNTPSVTVDVDGNVSLRGSSNFTVLIDGKPSIMDGSEALQQIPASTIQSIEIITNPSAKYDPDGVAGIINVVMKKNKISGVSGVFNVSAATQKQNSADFLVNYKTGKFNIFAGGNYQDFKIPGSMKLRRENYGEDTTWYLSNDADATMKRNGYTLRGGFDLSLDTTTSFSFSGDYNNQSFGRTMEGKYHQYSIPSTTDKYYRQSSGFDRTRDEYELNMYFQHKFSKPGHELSGSVDYSSETPTEKNPLGKTITNSLWVPVDSIDRSDARSYQSGNENDWRIKLDYTLPLSGKKKLEAGYQARFNNENNDYRYENLDPDQGLWIADSSRTNSNQFKNNMQAAYAIFSNSTNWFDYQVGLRVEYTDRLMKQKITDQEYPLYKLDYFPSVHLSKSLKYDQQVLLSYSRRINRPRSFYLDPFPMYIDPLNTRVGNPGLESEYTNSYELNYQKKFKAITMSVEGYYRQTSNMISQISKPSESDPLVMINTFENFNSNSSTGVELMADATVSKAVDLNLSGTVYHYKLNGTILGEDATSSTTTWNMRMNSNIRFKWGTRVQLMAFYNGPSISPQGTQGDFFMANIGVKQQFFKRKVDLTLQLKNVLNSMKFNSTSSQSGVFWTSTEFRRKGPVLGFTLTYRINNYREIRQKQQQEDESNGMDEMSQ